MGVTNRRAALHNLGCKVNAYETEAMQQLLEAAGYRIVPFDQKAEVYVINTCSVTNMADRKSRQMIHRARKMNPEAVVVAAGCYVQTAREKTGLAVDADIILGNNRKQELVRVLEEWFAERQTVREEIVDIGHTHEYETLRVARSQEHTRAFVKVQDGCDQFCSYCIIPYARGRVRSRQVADVIREIELLAQSGIREIVLTGIHLTSYGWGTKVGLLDLIRESAGVRGIERVRLGSLEPRVITEEFARALAAIPQVCPHFHLSLQSGSDSVLRRMNRKYTSGQFLEKCELLRDCFADPALTTDVIVGFPGETEEEFEETKAFLQRASFYETHIFKYSRREGTRAADMPEQVDDPTKARRSDELIALGREKQRAYEDRHLGHWCEALFEERQLRGGETFFIGHTREYLRVISRDEGRDLRGRLVRGLLCRDEAAAGRAPGQGADGSAGELLLRQPASEG